MFRLKLLLGLQNLLIMRTFDIRFLIFVKFHIVCAVNEGKSVEMADFAINPPLFFKKDSLDHYLRFIFKDF
jgi:hypothetical protein